MNINKLLIKITALMVLIFALSSCSSDVDQATVDLNFTLSYDDHPLVGFEELTYPLDFKVFFTKYSLFISDVTLVSTEGNHVLSNVEFLDLLTGVTNIADATSGKTLTYLDVPTRQYSGISFNIGVPTDLNATEPATYDASSPLSNNGEYWVGWSSYIFHKIEGKMDADGDGEPEAGIALHIGSDQAFRAVNVNSPIDINEERETIAINLDLVDILNIDGAFFDFIETPQIHHLGVLPKALPILDNTIKNIEVSTR